MNSFDKEPIIEEKIKQLSAILSEYCDAVQIHATWCDEDGSTKGMHYGAGNWHARKGMAMEFLERDKAREACQVEYTEYRATEDD